MQAKIKVTGIVQGVGFRPFIYRTATAHDLQGYVRNHGDAGVEVIVEGTEANVKHFLEDIKNKKPPQAQIYDICVHYSTETGEFNEFRILQSTEARESSGSVTPADIAICNQCLNELRNPKNPRHDYFFITCTDCGPRYTIIRQLPYDRQNTTMQAFQTCEFCEKEYRNADNRRFHAQTVACPKCGPKTYLTMNTGKPLAVKDPIREAGRLLEKGHILAIKGYGGFHVATAATIDEPLRRLRQAKHRAQKPFAIMAHDLETIKSFAGVSPEEAETLISSARPIVLLDKSENYHLSELIAPGLHNIGVMLPYTGLHFMLFDEVKEPAFVMTSANPPSEPIVADNDEALKTLGDTVDYFLFHDRTIAHRCDDSVLRHQNGKASFIRRSRGYAPAPIPLKRSFDRCVLGVGAEENVNASILLGDKVFISQHVGDVENLATLKFLQDTIRHILALTNTRGQLEAVACDLHPKFATTTLARKITEEAGCPLIPVQHHHAHAVSLLGEQCLDEMTGIICDGYGYGADEKAWGGEVLHCSKAQFERVGHLQEQPLIGGDLATRYPLRMAAGILGNTKEGEQWLLANSDHLPHGREEAKIIIGQLGNEHQRSAVTTSCGRVLDAVAAILGICYDRTYQGEPAMKLESAAVRGRDVLKLEPEIVDGVLNTTRIVQAVFEARNRLPTSDLAYSAESYLARGLAQIAAEAAQKRGTTTVGFSGGVAYNRHMTLTIKKHVEKSDVKFCAHEALPAGDGGVSFGQSLAAAMLLNQRN